MSSTTVAEFAKELKKPTKTLIEQLNAAGVNTSSGSDSLTEKDKQKLLTHLQTSHGTASTERKKISLVKKSTTEIKQADATGKARTIQVEVRKKRTFVKRDETDTESTVSEESQAPSAVVQPVIDHAELARREEAARRQAELIRRQEEELAEKRRAREAKEASAQTEAEVIKTKKSATKGTQSAEDEAIDAKAIADEEVVSKAKLAAKIALASIASSSAD
jgi:translation initiation factor IF-2